MPTAALGWMDVVVPLVAAAIGAVSGAAISWHLRRQELFAEAARHINRYLDEAGDALNELEPQEFDAEITGRAKRALSVAVFHSTRLESEEVTSRLRAADHVLWDMLDFEDSRGRLWAYRAIDDAMNAVVQFMKLPPLWRVGRPRVIPPNRFPSPAQYQELADPGEGERPNWRAVRKWCATRWRELESEG